MLFHLTGHVTDTSKIDALIEEEMRVTGILFAEGVMKRSLRRSDGPGVFTIIEAADEEEARRQMGRLPLVKGGVLEFDYAPVIDLVEPSDG
jgi:hypothetical protein